MKKLVLIDGNSVLYRAFYATPFFATSAGVQTNAVYGFLNMLIKTVNDLKPDYMLVAFDRKEPTYRHLAYDGYKATRKPMPEELVSQLPLVKQMLACLNICSYERAGLEADDIIGCAAKQYNLQSIIITGDRDSFQLVDEKTQVYFTRRGLSDVDIISLDTFKEKTGLDKPSQIVDLKSCMGDSSDNIPGIPGVGEKTALTLVNTYGSLDGVYEHVEELKGKLKEKVENGKDSAYMSKNLATIDTTSDLGLSEDDMKFAFPFPYSARAFLAELEFNTILKKNIFESQQPANSSEVVGNIVIKTMEQLSDKNDENSSISKTEKQQKKPIIKEILKTITTDINVFRNKKVALVCDKDYYLSDGSTEYIFKIREGFFDEGISLEEHVDYLKPLLIGEAGFELVVYDKKSLRRSFARMGYNFSAYADDVMLEKYVVDYTQKEMDLFGALERYGLNPETPASSLLVLHEKYSAELQTQELDKLYREIELPLCDVLYDMESAGFKIDVSALDSASVVYGERIGALADEIKRLAGEDFNVNSTKQLGEILFEKLGLRHGKKTKTGYSTSAEVLEDMVDEHPIIPLLLKYRQLSKLASTYIDGFRPLIDRNTGLIHTVFNQTVTSTGRLSSKEPNLQNIPVRDDEGKEIRKFFVARSADRILVDADYSQIELRLLAHYSGCEELIEAFNSGEDIHALTASQVFGVDIEAVTPEQRRSAKAVNFGIIYGISEYGLSKNIKVSPKTAAEYIQKYFDKYKKVKEYMNSNVEFVKANGFVRTAFGRRRNIPEIHSSKFNERSFAERAAMNMPLQGAAADIIKIAMINVWKRLKRELPEALLILQVHDELIVDVPEIYKEKAQTILREEMENAVKLSVPLTVNVECGKNWFDAK